MINVYEEFLKNAAVGFAVPCEVIEKDGSQICFLVREESANIKGIKAKIENKGLSTVSNNVVMVILLFSTIPSYGVFEIWFNYHFEDIGAIFFNKLISQKTLEFHFIGDSRTIERIIQIQNPFSELFTVAKAKIITLPKWTDDEFFAAREIVMRDDSIDDLWNKIQ